MAMRWGFNSLNIPFPFQEGIVATQKWLGKDEFLLFLWKRLSCSVSLKRWSLWWLRRERSWEWSAWYTYVDLKMLLRRGVVAVTLVKMNTCISWNITEEFRCCPSPHFGYSVHRNVSRKSWRRALRTSGLIKFRTKDWRSTNQNWTNIETLDNIYIYIYIIYRFLGTCVVLSQLPFFWCFTSCDQAQLFLAQLPWLLHSNSFGAMLKLQALGASLWRGCNVSGYDKYDSLVSRIFFMHKIYICSCACQLWYGQRQYNIFSSLPPHHFQHNNTFPSYGMDTSILRAGLWLREVVVFFMVILLQWCAMMSFAHRFVDHFFWIPWMLYDQLV